MTTHPTEGELRAYLDGETPPDRSDRIAVHVEGCARCDAQVSELRAAEAEIARALAVLEPKVDPAPARARVRRTLRGSSGRSFQGTGSRWSLARAALLILALAGGAAAAVPGSPVRAWIGAVWERMATPDAGDPVPAELTGEESVVEPAGVRVRPEAGSVRIVLAEVGPGTRIRVRLVDGPGAAVFAGTGTRFRTGPGTVEARISGDDVRVEVPRGAVRATVSVNGRTFFRKVDERVELPGPVRDTVESEFRFRLPGGDRG